MGNVERYGLLALFVLCALIVGVGIFGKDGTTVPDFERAKLERQVQPVPPEVLAKSNPRDGWEDTTNRKGSVDLNEGDDLRPVREDPAFDNVRGSSSLGEDHSGRKASFVPLDVPAKDTPNKIDTPLNVKTATREYVVKAGESYWVIAKNELGSPSAKNIELLRRLNPQYGETLPRNAKLVLPATAALTVSGGDTPQKQQDKPAAAGTVEYRVQKGDSLWKIAQKQLGSGTKENIDRIRRANPSLVGDRVDAGMAILLPLSSR